MIKLSVVLPTFNEKDNIIPLIKRLHSLLKRIGAYEIIVVDDNSPDGTPQVVNNFDHNSVRLIVRKNNRGLAKAIFAGLKKAQGEIIIVMDSDFNHNPNLIPQMITYLEYYDLIIGSRFVYGGGMYDSKRESYSYIFNLFIKIILRTRVHDNLSGFFAITRTALFKLPLNQIFHGYGDYFIKLVYFAKRKKYTILEIPAWYSIRPHGESKSKFITMLIGYTNTVLKLWLQDFKKRAR